MKIGYGALPLLVGNYARKFGVTLEMRGAMAYTDGKTITIPRLDLEVRENLDLACGYIGHEAGHIRFTDFSAACAKGVKSGTLFSLLNAMEDARIERLMVKSWPGMEATFDKVLKNLRRSLLVTILECKRHQDLTPLLILYCNSKAHEEWTTSPSLRAVRRSAQVALRSMLPAAAIRAVDQMISGVSYKDCTSDVLDVAEKVFKFIQKFVRKNNEDLNKQQNRQQEQDHGQQSQENGESSQEPDLFAGQPRDDQPLKKPNFNRLFKELGLDQETIKALEEDFSSSGKLKISTVFDHRQLPSPESEMNRRSAGLGVVECCGILISGKPRPGDNGDLFRKVSSGGFRVQVSDLMRSYDEWLNGCRDSGQELDIRAYANRKINNFHVFKARKIRQATNTAVTLLIDRSGSMGDEFHQEEVQRYKIANECALALALGMEGCKNLSREVVYFPGTDANFDDICTKDQSVRSRAGYFAQKPRGGTPLTQALLHAVERLPEKSPYQRNIIIVLTDGKPDSSISSENVINRCAEFGIEVYAIGIGEKARVADLPFLATETVLDVRELPAAMKRLMKRAFFRKPAFGSVSLAKAMVRMPNL